MLRTKSSTCTSGIGVAASSNPALAGAVNELKEGLPHSDYQHIIAFFSTEFDPGKLCEALSAAFPGVPISGCTTAGEISPLGMTRGSILIIAFPHNRFRILADKIENIRHSGVDGATTTMRRLMSQFRTGDRVDPSNNTFALLLIDGLSNYEETILAAINWEIGDMPLLGGSSGDDLAFKKTAVICDGEVVPDGAVVIMVETTVPFMAFKTQNFDPTGKKLVVTKADSENRIVHELNAEPAAREYADAIGLLTDDLGPFSFASYPLVVKVGGNYYCRSIRNMNPDGSLSFFCAIDEGLVLTVANPVDMVKSTDTTLSEIHTALGGIDLVIGFDCILRRLDAENRQIRHDMEELYRRHHVVGFQTYGEQYNAMHINQTLTGIAFGETQSKKREMAELTTD